MNNRDVLAQMIAKQAVVHAMPGEDFLLSNGDKTDYYIDCRRICLTPHGLKLAADLFFSWYYEYPGVNAFGGPTVGADPIVGAVAYTSSSYSRMKDNHFFLVRGADKGYGLGGRVIGSARPGDKCLLIDDVLTSGKSLLSAAEAVEDFGMSVAGILILVDRNAGGRELLSSKGYNNVTSLFSLGDIGL